MEPLGPDGWACNSLRAFTQAEEPGGFSREQDYLSAGLHARPPGRDCQDTIHRSLNHFLAWLLRQISRPKPSAKTNALAYPKKPMTGMPKITGSILA